MKPKQLKKTKPEIKTEAAVKIGKDEDFAEDPKVEAADEKVKIEVEAEQNEKSVAEPEEAGSDEDDNVVETAIIKEEPTIPSKVKSGQIPVDFPHDQVVHVNKLPKSFKLLDVVEIFAKYGSIDMIHFHQGPVDCTANVAFKTATAATAALAANKQEMADGSTIIVAMKKVSAKKQKANQTTDDSRERCVYVKYLKRGTKEEQLKEHFSACGEIENVRVILKNSISFGFVTFVDKASVDKALELHNKLLNGNNIGVFRNKTDASDNLESRNPSLTIILRNTQSLESIEIQKLETIFEKCGEISNMDVVCKKKILAFITFKTEEGKQKALQLNGKTLEELEIDIEAYNPDKLKTSIFIINVAKDVTEEEIQSHFAKAGEISAVILRKGFAIVHFKESEGYCKSFLLNETILKGQMIFLEPYSVKKQSVMKYKQNTGVNKKRPAQNGKGVFNTPKRLKVI